MTFDEVIEDYQIKMGADKVHVDLGPEATPDGLMGELRKLAEKENKYNSFPEVAQLKAVIARYKERLSEIGKLGQVDIRKWIEDAENDTVNKKLIQLKTRINQLTDMFPDVDLERDIEFCEKMYPYGYTHPESKFYSPLV